MAHFRFIAYQLEELGLVTAETKGAATMLAERRWPGRVVHLQSEASVAVAKEEFQAVLRRMGRRNNDDEDDGA